MTALITEFIPFLEEKYNLGGSGEKRFLAGHSSGGWSSLWLQIQNPDFFNGAWALAPDPVDFHYFQTADLYHSLDQVKPQSCGRVVSQQWTM